MTKSISSDNRTKISIILTMVVVASVVAAASSLLSGTPGDILLVVSGILYFEAVLASSGLKRVVYTKVDGVYVSKISNLLAEESMCDYCRAQALCRLIDTARYDLPKRVITRCSEFNPVL